MTFEDIIKEAVAKHNDIGRATDYAVDRLNQFPKLVKAELQVLIYQAVRANIYRAQTNKRHVAKLCPRGIDAIMQAAPAKMASLLDSWVVYGKQLGDYTGTELMPEEAKARNQAAGHMKNAEFFKFLIAKAQNDKIRDCVTAEEAAAKWHEISNQGRSKAV